MIGFAMSYGIVNSFLGYVKNMSGYRVIAYGKRIGALELTLYFIKISGFHGKFP
jgi:hypothetical protein